MYVLSYTETNLKVKQLWLARVKPSADEIIVAPQQMKYLIDSKLKNQFFEKGVEELSFKGKKPMRPNHRFKTEKCRQFYELGYCDYGSKCMFAHGQHEINEDYLVRPRNYKTRMCITFQLDGYCTFGSRCSFVHTHHDPIELLEATIAGIPRIPMPENLQNKSRPEFYPSDILTRKPNREMVREEMLLPSEFQSDHSVRLSTFVRLTNNKK